MITQRLITIKRFVIKKTADRAYGAVAIVNSAIPVAYDPSVYRIADGSNGASER
jgi:hypothetical protein